MNKKGLTLVELLVVISIIVIMSGILIFNADDSGGTIDILNQSHNMKQDIYGAREKTLSGIGREHSNDYYGIGAYFDTSVTGGNYYLIYVNSNDDRKYDSSEDTILKKVYLEENLTYDTVGDYNQIIYIPPIAKAYFCNATSCSGIGSLEVKIENIVDDTKNGIININGAGVIE